MFEDFDVKSWADECGKIEATNNVEVAGYLLATIGNAVYVEYQAKDIMVKKVYTDEAAARHGLIMLKIGIEAGIASISELVGINEAELPGEMVAYDQRRRLGKRYECGSYTSDRVLGDVDTLADAMSACRKSGGHCYIIDRQAEPGGVRRYEFRDGRLSSGDTRPNGGGDAK